MVSPALVFMLAAIASGLREETAAVDDSGPADESAAEGIGRLSAGDAAAKKWTFFFKEWCPSTQEIFAELQRKGLLSAFMEKVGTENMRCFSSFEDFIASGQNVPQYGVRSVRDITSKFQMIDPNDFPGRSSSLAEIPCDRFFTKHETTVRNEMKKAWDSNKDESCRNYGNGAYTVPALVVGGVKFCETRLLKKWLSDNMKAVSEAR